jgi:hypothetical protein
LSNFSLISISSIFVVSWIRSGCAASLARQALRRELRNQLGSKRIVPANNRSIPAKSAGSKNLASFGQLLGSQKHQCKPH